MNTRQKGKRWEEAAVKYLLKNNYKVIRQNYYTRWGEVDIIVWDELSKELVFVEVKGRTSNKYGYAEEAIDENKLGKIMRAAEDYLNKAGYGSTYRFDCLSIEFDYAIKKAKVRHLKNICF